MNLTRILVAVDAPNGRDAAFERALMLARSSGAELTCFTPCPRRKVLVGGSRATRTDDGNASTRGGGGTPRAEVEQHGDHAEIIDSMPTRVQST